MSGKWHISHIPAEMAPNIAGPANAGLTNIMGLSRGAANFWKPNTLTRNNTRIEHDELPEDYFLTDAISDEAVSFIQNHTEKHRNVRSLLMLLTQHRTGPCTHTKKTSHATMDVSLLDGTNSEKSGSHGCGR